MTTYGYARARTVEAVEDQAVRLEFAGCERVYKDLGHPGTGWATLVERLQPGDTIKVVNLDRLARSMGDSVRAIQNVARAGAELALLDGDVDLEGDGDA